MKNKKRCQQLHSDGLHRVRRPACHVFCFFLYLLLLSGFISCVNVKYVAIDQFVPAAYPLPEGLSIAVLNNLSPYNVSISDKGLHLYSCDGDSLMEHVAQAFADAGIFAEVVVLDSCLYPVGDTIYHLLTPREVDRLCDTLDVDLLYVCDYGCITSWGPEADDGDRKFYLASHVYTSGRTTPTHSFIIDGEWRRGTYRTKLEVARWLRRSYPELARRAAECFAPHWETCDRSFYSGTAYNLREATVCVNDGDWEGAYQLWQKQAQKKNPRQRLISLYNQALYHEMNDSLDLALRLLDEADTYTTDTTAIDSTLLQLWYEADVRIGEFPYTDHQRIVDYRSLLHQRQKDVLRLMMTDKSESE